MVPVEVVAEATKTRVDNSRANKLGHGLRRAEAVDHDHLQMMMTPYPFNT